MTEEKGAGLHTVGRLANNWLVEPVRDAIAEGSVDGMSFRFSVVREEWRDANGKVLRDPVEIAELLWTPGGRGPLMRTLKEVKITEAGPVVWPAYAETSVGVRSKVTIDLGRLRDDPEQRRLLAQAVLIADTTTRTTDGPGSTEQPTDEHARSAPRVTEQPTGDHPSAPQARKPNPARAFAQSARGYLLTIDKKD
jgi:hypothetical protein